VSRTPIAVTALAVAVATATAPSAQTFASRPAIAGVWVLNRSLSPALNADQDIPRTPEQSAGRRRSSPWEDGARSGGGAAPRINEKDVRRARVARDRLTDVIDRFSIVIDGTMLSIVDGLGRVTKLRADGKRQERVTGDGEFISTTRFDGDRLIVEDDFGRPKIITTYEPLIDGSTRRLQVTVRVEGLTRYRFGMATGKEELQPRVSVYDADPSIQGGAR
jgi:hypothetical protein